MKKAEKLLILLVLFVALIFVSIATVYFTSQIPSQEIKTTTKCTYSSNATYNWTATLAPNVIENNITRVGPEEGPLYTSLTKQIDLTLNYIFEASLPAEVKVTYRIEQSLKTANWGYTIIRNSETTTNETQFTIQFSPFNKTDLEKLKQKIEAETGTSSLSYSFEIVPTFTVDANTSAGPIRQNFTPTLSMNVGQTDQGNTITIDNLQQIETGAITENVTVVHNELIYQRYASYIFLVGCVAGLGLSAYWYRKTHVSMAKVGIDKLTSHYKDLVIETKDMPEFSEDTPKILVKDLEELGKAAEILAKPIFYARRGTANVFYVFDADITYICRKEEGET
jgi:hypothetical protein